MERTVGHLSLYCIISNILNLVNSFELESASYGSSYKRNFFSNISVVQSSKGPTPSHGDIGRDWAGSYLAASKLVTTRNDQPQPVTLLRVDPTKIEDEKYCKLFCRQFSGFPISAPDDQISEAAEYKFVVFLNFLQATAADPVAVMKTCNDATKAKCMADILKPDESEPTNTDPSVDPSKDKNKDGQKLGYGLSWASFQLRW
ncbi:hypothetical protein RF11_08401 [Thelohanellus kitauei]|uniref:Uncharacterized protein n=1 Tax=Thelohanellus kitauei TaxID=669202 RepID=A0A0C2MZK3_THEKT|nr:hypothetical protein RF11_08401 [Thelohanellus kitauei]